MHKSTSRNVHMTVTLTDTEDPVTRKFIPGGGREDPPVESMQVQTHAV